MGTYCASFAEKQNSAGEWEVVFEGVFPEQNYRFFGWLGLEYRNYAKVPPIGVPTRLTRKPEELDDTDVLAMGFPSDLESALGPIEYTYPASLFIEFDYYQKFEDRQVWVNEWVKHHASIRDDETGIMQTYAFAWTSEWLDMVDTLKEKGIERIRFHYC